MKTLNVKLIRTDGDTQSRVKLDQATVNEYAEAIREGEKLPPVTAFFDGSDYWLADGFHRFHAYIQERKASIPAEVEQGTLQAAKLFAAGSNAVHGLRRTNDDKRRSVQMVIAAKGDDWTDREIANHCGVSHPFVAAVRRPESVPERQQGNRDEAASRRQVVPARVESDSTLSTGATEGVHKKEAARPAANEPEREGPSEEEIREAEEAAAADLAAAQKMLTSDQPLADAVAEVKRLTALTKSLELRITGLINEKDAAIRSAKSWQRKYDQVVKQAA